MRRTRILELENGKTMSPVATTSKRFQVTGSAAHMRLTPLLPSDWQDLSHRKQGLSEIPHFLWEFTKNAPRHETRQYRDNVICYSHLPNGTMILDSKWVLAKVFGNYEEDHEGSLATLESYCFRGISGFEKLFTQLFPIKDELSSPSMELPDLLANPSARVTVPSIPPSLWVVKDASSNGAGGIWIVGSANAREFSDSSPLIEEHRYVAQRYAWPPVLYDGRKCHVRVYGLITADGRAFVHKRAFLHVANDSFSSIALTEPSVHITNCCANSHDPSKFAGEICADFESLKVSKDMVGLAKFFPSVKASLASLAKRAFPYIHGGEKNNGFEYLGIDFILSYRNGKPVAYMLEVNAPPSQDTATGLPHAEELHDTVISDLLHLWVYPKILGNPEQPGGWRVVYTATEGETSTNKIAPSKAAILNKIRWTIFERKQQSLELKNAAVSIDIHRRNPKNESFSDRFAYYARKFFPYFDCKSLQRPIFFENAGGAQVPQSVVESMTSSLSCRNRCKEGKQYAKRARRTIHALLGSNESFYSIFLGANATTLLHNLATWYVDSGMLKPTDEIIISTENHLANIKPWVYAARRVGATVKWWTRYDRVDSLLNQRTRIIAVPHVSNVLGEVRDIASLRKMVQRLTGGYGHLIVDGVAAAPHVFANIDLIGVEWYVVSCHKLFGPHIGALCGKTSLADGLPEAMELGTVSYEACSGIEGIGKYFLQLSNFPELPLSSDEECSDLGSANTDPHGAEEDSLWLNEVFLGRELSKRVYDVIALVEETITYSLIHGLQRSKKVRILNSTVSHPRRIPVVSFVHEHVSHEEIIAKCKDSGIIARSCSFLCAEQFLKEYDLTPKGVVRFSLCHYNTSSEIFHLLNVLESIAGWF